MATSKPATKRKRKKAPAKRKKPMGRPRIVIDYEQVERLAAMQCTEHEIALVIGLTPEGFRQRKLKDADLLGVLEKGRAKGSASLRRLQWERAQAGDKTMLIWLGKQYLGQKDKNEVDTNQAVHVNIIRPDRSKDAEG
jgi:hypothetical protein